jgi:hypothetical protein
MRDGEKGVYEGWTLDLKILPVIVIWANISTTVRILNIILPVL